ncbi:S24/S26 family peptidase [Nocardioides zeae]|uniref:S24/S26 family peptidase n=1 Tax=Nocardioides imazamoxiresistens TaxID=3231893 RepID=A0ABU3Q0P0_9ACTN|nr:S24/S26 family peptidase [Nocardioides zeae]MDT9595073.1 S24/S26 family peptidase [Nocardioides zeae]
MDQRPGGGPRRERGLLPWGPARVRGGSMEPTLAPGDLLWVRWGAPVRPGQVVVARFVDGTLAVKRAVEPRPTRTGDPGWWLLSDAPEVGVDSRHRGPVAAPDVLGVARARLWPRPRRLRTAPRSPDGPTTR